MFKKFLNKAEEAAKKALGAEKVEAAKNFTNALVYEAQQGAKNIVEDAKEFGQVAGAALNSAKDKLTEKFGQSAKKDDGATVEIVVQPSVDATAKKKGPPKAGAAKKNVKKKTDPKAGQ